jgi:hypothetical protein
MKYPGVLWTMLLVLLPLLADWLSQYFGVAQWALPLAGLLLIAAKTLEVMQAGQEAQAESTLEIAHEEKPEEPVSAMRSWLVG